MTDENTLDEEDFEMYNNTLSEKDKKISERTLKGIVDNIEILDFEDLSLNDYLELFDWTDSYLVWKTFPNYKQQIIKNLHKNLSLKICREYLLVDYFYSFNHWDFAKVLYEEIILSRLDQSVYLQTMFGFKFNYIKSELLYLKRKAANIRGSKSLKQFVEQLKKALASPAVFDYKREVHDIAETMSRNKYIKETADEEEIAGNKFYSYSSNPLAVELLKILINKDNSKYKQLLRMGFCSKRIKKFHFQVIQKFVLIAEDPKVEEICEIINTIHQYDGINLEKLEDEMKWLYNKLDNYLYLNRLKRILYVLDDKFTNNILRKSLLMK